MKHAFTLMYGEAPFLSSWVYFEGAAGAAPKSPINFLSGLLFSLYLSNIVRQNTSDVHQNTPFQEISG